MTSVIGSLTSDQSTDASLELLTDVTANFSSLLTEQHYHLLADILTSPWSEPRYNTLLQGNFDFDSFQFGQLLLAYGEARVPNLISATDQQSHTLLRLLCGLLSADGVPAVEDKIFVQAVEFWSTYVECLTDEVSPQALSADSSTNSSVSFALEAISHGWQRISFPSSSESGSWDMTERAGFVEARKEFADLLQSTFALTGPQIVFKFSELVVTSLTSSSWTRLEGSAFCLGSLAECIKDDLRCDAALFSVFSSSLFSTIQSTGSNLPYRTQQTCVLLVEQYTEYFERNTSLLPPALNLLFGLVGEPSLAPPASKSILRLCSSCRHHLFGEIESFLYEYQTIIDRQKLDCLSVEKILGGIACVAQGIDAGPARLDAIRKLLAIVEADSARSLELAKTPSLAAKLSCSPGFRCVDGSDYEDPALHMATRTLRSLAAIGKGFRSPHDAPVDLDGTRKVNGQTDLELSDVHNRIFDIIVRLESTFPSSGEVVETICSIVRSGFSESDSGPFVFPPQHVVQYLTTHTAQSPRIGALVSTACSFMSSLDQTVEPTPKHQLLSETLLWIISLLRNLPGESVRWAFGSTVNLTQADPESDTELSQNAVEFVTRLVAKMPQVLLRLQPSEAAEFLFLFTLRVLDGKEPLPKAASAEFWVSPHHLAT